MRWRFHPIHIKLFLFSKAFQSLLTVITLPESQLGIEKSLRNHYTITIDCMAVRHCCSLRRDAFRLNVLGDDVVNESRRIGQVTIQLMYSTTTRNSGVSFLARSVSADLLRLDRPTVQMYCDYPAGTAARHYRERAMDPGFGYQPRHVPLAT